MESVHSSVPSSTHCRVSTMTTSGPEQNAPPGWIESQSGDSGTDTKQLELGISGINLSSFSGGNRPPTLSGSSVSTNPEDQSHSRQHSFGSYNGNVDPAGGHRGTPPSPASPMYRGQSMPSFSTQNKPPGLTGPFPSPIGKAGSSNTSTAMSSPHLTLTPSSSIDQGEAFSQGRQTSPLGSTIPSYQDPQEAGEQIRRGGSPWSEPANNIPRSVSAFSQPPSQKESGLGGAFSASTDNEDFDSDLDDGLRGLGALRERAHSSPGPLMGNGGGGFAGAPFSSSPPVSTSNRLSSSPTLHTTGGDFRDDGSYGNRSFPSDPRRSRTPSKDGGKAVSRPPLSGAVSSSHNIFNEGGSNLSNQMDRHDSRSADWTDNMGRGRSLSMGTMNTRDLMQIHQQDGDFRTQSHIDQSHSQKFGSMPSLSSHAPHQQRMPPQSMQQQYGGIQQPLGHVRSYSQPGPNPFRGQAEMHENPNVFEHNLEYSPARGDIQYLDEGDSLHSGHVRGGGGGGGRYGQQMIPPQLSRSISAGNTMPPSSQMHGVHPRSAGMSHPSYGEPMRRSSYSGSQSHYQGHHPGLQRRDALDFDGRPHREEPRPVMATREEMNMYGIHGREQEGYSIGGAGRHERLPQGSGVHNRHHSDGGGVLSSAMSHGNRESREHRRDSSYHSVYEDNLDHPLAGEFIDDPIDDYPPHGGRIDRYDMSDPYGERRPHGHTSRHSFTSTSMLDQQQPVMARHYGQIDSHHHAPALPTRSLPRTVYNIKFKRSQRNFVAGPRINRDLDIGCYVKVEADRGEDLGIVVGKMTAEKFNHSAGRASFRPPSSNPNDLGASGTTPTCAADLKRVIRLATHDEVSLLTVKREEEDELLRICRTKVRQRALPMNVVDAEYQFDRHKLTFFFEAEGRVDFRELVRDLFSIYKTRIWMQQLDKNVGTGLDGLLDDDGPDRDDVDSVGPEYGASGGSDPQDIGRDEGYTN